MKLARLLCLSAAILSFSNFLFAQTAPDLENGFKISGSYHGSDIDTVDLKSGNLMVHIPMPWSYPQRGGEIAPKNLLTVSSKTWNIKCVNPDGSGNHCFWTPGNLNDMQVATAGSGLGFAYTSDLSVHRTWGYQTDTSLNVFYYSTGYSVATPDGGKHTMVASPGAALDPNGDPMAYDATDGSGFHIVLSNPNPTDGTPDTAVALDRHGNRYSGTWTTQPNCRAVFDNGFAGNSSSKSCAQATRLSSITDANGNVFAPTNDTMGRSATTLTFASSSDSTNCVLSGLPFSSSKLETYPGPNGATNQVKLCYATVTIATAFGLSGTSEAQSTLATNNGSPATGELLTTVILPDGSKWVFSYDSYFNLSYIGLPTGGSISYSWQTLSLGFPCNKISRVISSRTLNDNNGHSSTWNYFWGQPQSGSLAQISNRVTDPLGNDTVHVFTDPAGRGTCLQYETQTQQFQGSSASGQLLKQVDTTYLAPGVGYVLPTNIQTTLFPSNKVSLVTKSYDSGLGAGLPIFGNVVTEKEYDWGQGTPGALLRESDTTYQWQVDSRYLAARLLDLPSSVVIISPNSSANVKTACPSWDSNGNATTKACMAETDYTYDEAAYITGYEATVGALPTGTHIAAPNPVRGLQTTASHWLNTSNSLIASHTNWYDTGEAHQGIDPLGHTTTHSYDPSYAGAYSTQTCSPATGGITHCASGTYDFQTGALSSLTDENSQTSNFTYDTMGRLTLAQAPPDPANGNTRAQTSLNFSAANVFPLSVQRTKSITTALSDSATNFFDGLGRVTNGQHTLPGGTAEVDTIFDAFGRPATVSNPYFSTSDPTYGTTTSLYDALGRVYKTTKQDGSVSSAAYSVATTVAANGDCVQTTDEAGNQHGACSDALGRLVEVDEPNPGSPINVNNKATLLTDGNFVLENAAGTGVWSTGTSGSNATSIYMQDDANLVLYIFKWQAGTYATPSPGPFPAQGCNIGSYLMINQRISANQCLVSPHGQYMLFMASDGNFFIYDLAHNVGTWGPGTSGHPGAYAIMQGDGNLCVYTATNTYLWCSGTSGTNAERLNMEDDGRIIIYKSAWNSGTSNGQYSWTAIAHPGCDVGNSGLGQTGVLGSGSCLVSPNGRFELLMQGDGNLVIYDRSITPNAALWSTGTATSPADPGYAMRTLYSYDALGNLLRVDQKGTAPNDSTQWRTRTFTYDSLSRLLTANNPESGTITYSYDADGNLLQKISPAPNQTGTATQTVSYCYDALHRVTGKGYGAQTCPLSTPAVTYAYDSGTNAKGKLTSMIDQAGTATYSYDVLGRMTTETRPIAGISKSTGYTYNLDGSVKTLTYPSGRVVTYTPAAGGVLTSAVDGNGTQYVSNAAYYANGAEYTRSMPGIFFSATLNSRLQIAAFYSNNGTDAVLFVNKAYDYGTGHNNGNVLSISNYKDSNRTQTFTYDALNRITSAWSSANTGNYSWGENYSIDAWGNLQISPMSGKAHGGTFQLSGNAQNRPTGLAYDAAGNLTSYLSSTYTYDQENRLLSTAGTTYTYDGNGERVLKSNTSTGAAVKRYWSMGGNTLAEGDGSGNLTAEYIYFGGKRVARIDLPANTVHYYLSDHLGSTSVIVSSAGAVEEESDYYPFGTEVVVSGPGANELKFTGKRRDTESQLDYFGARYYSSIFGRFLSADWSAKPSPIPYAEIDDPQSLNLFSYVRNLPAARTDPSGHKVEYLPNKKNAEEANRRILSNVSKAEKKLFKMEKDKDSGKYKLKLDAKAAANFKGEHTVGYDKLVAAVNSDKTATVSVQSTLGATGEDGQWHVYNLARDFGGAATEYLGNGNSLVALSPEGNSSAPDQWHTLGANGEKMPDPVGIIAGHELLGHALEHMIGGDTSENKAQQVEKQLRQEQGVGERVP